MPRFASLKVGAFAPIALLRSGQTIAETRSRRMSEIVWEDPPERKAIRWTDKLAPVRENPGRWAKFVTPTSKASASSTVVGLRKGNVTGIEPDEWDFENANIDGQGFIYAMYLGPAGAETDAVEFVDSAS
jgi:hypothetical protein